MNLKLKSDTMRFEVNLSMVEIYNEKVQDLLVPKTSKPKEDLQVREDPIKGVYVQDANEVPVSSYEEIQNQIDTGTANRAIG